MKRVRICLLYAVMALLTLVFLLPLGYAVVISLVSFEYVNKIPPPYVISLDNHRKLFENYPILQWYVNTVPVTMLTLTGNIATGLLASYTLAKLEFRGRKFVFNSVLAILMIPFQLLPTPPYIMVASLGWHNTIKGLVIPFMVSSLSTFMARQFYLLIPDELIEMARVDGPGYVGFYFRVVLPLSEPLIPTLTMLNFISCWNAYLVSSALLAKTERLTLTVGLNTIRAANFIRPNETMAGVVPLSFPVLTVFFFFQKGLIGGITNPGTKGQMD